MVRAKLAEGEDSRKRLAADLCDRFQFRDARGKLRVSSCLKALRDLERAGEFRLPRRLIEINDRWSPRRLLAAVPEPHRVPESVSDLRDLRVILVDPADDAEMRSWNELMLREHPWGGRRLVGRQLRYLVSSEHGLLGAVGFAASALTLAAREAWIGWDEAQRQAHRDRVLNLSRLLIRPSVRCRNLASWVLGACARRVGQDFAQRYGYAPWLLETFVDTAQHEGTCFQAANWQRIGETKGRGRNDRTRCGGQSVKDIYVYPLVGDFRERMGIAPDQGSYLRPLLVEQGLGAQEWVAQEFGEVDLGDKRLRDRLMKIVGDRAEHPDGSYLEASGGDYGAEKGYYAFIDNPRETIDPEAMLSTHRTRTIERMMSQDLVLVVQDTTDLNFSSRPHTMGLGLIGTNQTGTKSLGLKLHTSLALSEEGLPLGVLKPLIYAPEEKGEEGKVSVGRPIEEKKSFRWIEGYRDCVAIAKQMPDTRILSVMDREADIFELFKGADPTRHRVGLLVRARYNRRLEGSEQKLFEQLRDSENTQQIEMAIPRQRWKTAKRSQPKQAGAPSRRATLTLSFQAVSIRSTRSDLRALGSVKLWAVYAREESPPPGSAAIEWMLLTTEEVKTVEQATRMLGLYSRRWRIEEWHRVLKSGCKVQDHQHQTVDRLERVIAIDAVLAWRIQLMTLLSREVPDLPCTVFFDEWEVTVLEALEEERRDAPLESPLTLVEAITSMARLGGYLARRSDPPPGAKVLWRGLIRLSGMVEGYRLAQPRGP
ncbi:MAG: IS4 family transposase [Myxococcota bacterium]